MNSAYFPDQIVSGADVFGADGEKVGVVASAYPGYIVVEKGFFFPTDYYVPVTAISQQSDGAIYLNVTKDAALHSGWEAEPVDLATAPLATDAAWDASATDVLAEEEIRIPLREEELTATVRSQDIGAVRIEKDVITEERTLDVPVTEERIRVEHRIVDRPAVAGDAASFEETVVTVPLRSEVVDVETQARVAEEVVISKEEVQHTERVKGKVRREEVSVDEGGVVEPRHQHGTDAEAGQAL